MSGFPVKLAESSAPCPCPSCRTRRLLPGEPTFPPSISFTVPGPPVPCARARVYHGADGKAHAVTPAKTRAYKALVGMLALAARTRLAGPTWNPEATYAVTLHVWRAEARGDWDNYAKALCDALTGVLWRDDSQVIEAHVFMHVDRVNPRAEVCVETR